MEAIDKDQARLRENMKALKGSPEEKALLQGIQSSWMDKRTGWRR
jgi:uncharacterized protein YecT (DUF1311 family)